MNYSVDFQNGKRMTGYESMQAAQEAAVKNATYTGEPMLVRDGENMVVAYSPFYHFPATEKDARYALRNFGDLGWYDGWVYLDYADL